jgi:hypothetical protein
MERVYPSKDPKIDTNCKQWLPKGDIKFANKHLENNLNDLTRCVKEMTKLKLLPEDEWFKAPNLIGGKIVDFHFFTKKDDRYLLPSTKTKEEVGELYNNALARYKSRGDNKFKGKIYQGFKFNNGYDMIGYSSNGADYDSYTKLPFCFMRKGRNKNVLDCGTNEGFFATQAYLHGAKSVTGMDIVPEDIALANDIKNIVGADNSINFVLGDAMKHILTTDEQYEVIIMNSVLHQVYKNMVGSGPILNAISKKTQYFVYETPVNHPLMSIGLSDIYKILLDHFCLVKLLYIYDCYSSGYRANFVCYAFEG